MKAKTGHILIACVLISLVARPAVAEINVFARVDASADIYVGESFTYNIIIDGDNRRPTNVNETPLAQYNPQEVGGAPQSSSSVTIINGKMTKSVTKRYVMNYALTAGGAGRIQLQPVTVTIDGKDYQTNPVEVSILEPGTTDKLDLEVKLSDTTCYVGQPVIMTVNFYRSVQIGDFSFIVPPFNSDEFVLEDPDVSGKGAKQYRLGSGVHVFVNEYRVTHKGKESILLTFSKVLIPKYAGQIRLAPASISADVAVGRQKRRGGFFDDFFGRTQYKRFMTKSNPLTLTVLPLPEEDKPEDFYGLVGRYSISASASPTEVSRGDPITLTVRVGGNKYLKPVQWPVLEQIPEMAQNFKIPSERSSPTMKKGFKVFTQTVRPNNNDVTRIPPIPLAFFDVDKGKYVVSQTEPIELKVSPAKKLTAADLMGLDSAPVIREVEAIKKGLSANYESPDILTNQSFSPVGAAITLPYATIWALPLVALITSTLIKLFTHTTPEKVAARRRRRACAVAVAQLKKIVHDTSAETHETLAAAMKQYIGARFDRTAGSLTAQDCYEIINAATNNAQAADKYRDIIDQCESARYAAVQAHSDSAKVDDVIKLIRRIEKKSKK